MAEKHDISQFARPSFDRRVIAIVGGYGSGKSEVSVNLARYLVTSVADSGEPVSIVDLDIVNPYFRSREAAAELEKLGIRPVNPKGSQFYADLPIVLPEIKGTIESATGWIVLDVGGDDVGARVLSSLANAFKPDTYDLLLVLNANRPFTATVEGTQKIIHEIEASSRLKFTGLISNTHLMEHTTTATIFDGISLAKKVSDKTSLTLKFVSVTSDVLRQIDPQSLDIPVLPLNRSLLKPWERRQPTGDNT